MIRSKRRANKDYLAFVYAGLCMVVALVGWMVVMMISPSDAAFANGSADPASSVIAAATPSRAATTPGATPYGPGDLAPTDGPAASPTKASFNVDLYRPGTFVSQMDKESCTAGAILNMLNIMGPTIDLTTKTQQDIAATLVSLTTRQDSYNGGFGPAGWALTMAKLGAGQYKLVVDPTFDQAMRDAAIALAQTMRPVGLLTWWGAHSWVMTGFRSDADPAVFPKTFKLKGAYIVDPFYPRVSTIWGKTLGPDSLRDMFTMAQNYLPWKRPEGHYPDRDGKWLLVIPTVG
jgi:hypothetical protein